MLNARKTIILAFVLTTVLFSVSTAYSSYFYFQLYHAVRAFSVSIEKFSFYSAQSILQTEMTIQNPSDLQFDILLITEEIELEYDYITNVGIDRQMNPMKFLPYGNVTVTLTVTVPDTKIQMVASGMEKLWQLTIFLRISGPAVGEFTVARDFETKVNSV